MQRTSYIGPIPDDLWKLLEEIREHGLSVSTDLARYAAPEVGLAASMGWITTISTDGATYGRRWLITSAGLTAMHNKDLFPTCSSS